MSSSPTKTFLRIRRLTFKSPRNFPSAYLSTDDDTNSISFTRFKSYSITLAALKRNINFVAGYS